MITEVIFDIETKKLFQVSIVSLYRRQLDDNFNEINGQILSFWQQDFDKMWPLFADANRVIGFNSLGFDVPAIAPLCSYNFKNLNHFDILAKVKESLGFRLSLDAIAKETLGTGKIDVGTNAVLYWNQQTPESLTKLKHYCEADVLITKDIYDYGLKYKQLKYKDKWNTPRIIEVDFSYPKAEIYPQISLF